MAQTRSGAAAGWAAGGMLFAAIIMVVSGIFSVLMGLAAIIKHEFFVVSGNYLYKVNVTAWGWISLGVGALVLLTGVFLFTGATWARVIGIVVASLSAIDNFFYIPYYPVWSLLVIALDIFVIWSLATVGRARREVGTATAAAMSGEPWPYANPPAEAAAGRDVSRPTPTAGREMSPPAPAAGQPPAGTPTAGGSETGS